MRKIQIELLRKINFFQHYRNRKKRLEEKERNIAIRNLIQSKNEQMERLRLAREKRSQVQAVNYLTYDSLAKELTTPHGIVKVHNKIQLRGLLIALFVEQKPNENISNKDFFKKHRKVLVQHSIHNSNELRTIKGRLQTVTNMNDLFHIRGSMQCNPEYIDDFYL